jgi:hypothetical protein
VFELGFGEQTRLQASDAAAGDSFGSSIALSSDGNTMAVGAENDDNSGGTNAGSVYIFKYSGTTWTEQTRLQASNAETLGLFGTCVAFSSNANILAVGSYGSTNSGGTSVGSVYTFTYSGTTWSQQTRLQASDAASNDKFGSAVALSSDGNTLAIGSVLDDNSGGTDAGSVYIFTYSGSAWSQQTRLQASDAATSNAFGNAIVLSYVGSVYIFSRMGTTWSEKMRLQAPIYNAWDFYGTSLALSADGNTIAVGASSADNSGGTDAGSVYVHSFEGPL